MSEAKEYRISNLSVDKNGWMHVVLSRGDDSVIDDAYIKLVEYSALAAKDAEIEQLKKRISWLESGFIHTCHAECEKPLCVANREIERLKAELTDKDAVLRFCALGETQWDGVEAMHKARECLQKYNKGEL